jgi:hypothetical protein
VKPHDVLMPDGQQVAFSEIEATLARLERGSRRKRPPARALTATVVVVGRQDRLIEAATALEHLREGGGVRAILISEGTHTAPPVRVTEQAVAIDGLSPRFLNNAVAALRLSSLPTAVWWRGGSPDALTDVAILADRLVIDTEQPVSDWQAALTLFETTAVTDLHWTRLTHWRAALAHLFDLPEVRSAPIRRLCVQGSDPFAARLFAGWLRSSLRWGPDVAIELQQSQEPGQTAPLETVTLDAGARTIALSVHPARTCLRGDVNGRDLSPRIVPLDEGGLTPLIAEELAVRSRDLVFERALGAAMEIPAWA